MGREGINERTNTGKEGTNKPNGRKKTDERKLGFVGKQIEDEGRGPREKK